MRHVLAIHFPFTMGYDFYTYFGIFKTNDDEKKKLIEWLTTESDSASDTLIRKDMWYGIKQYFKWNIITEDSHKSQGNTAQALSANFPNLTFFFVCLGEESDDFNYLIAHNGEMMVFKFALTSEEESQRDKINELYSEDSLIDPELGWDEDLYRSKIIELGWGVMKRKLNEMNVDDLSDVFDEPSDE